MSGILERASEITDTSRAAPLSAILQATCEERNFKVNRLRSNLLAVDVDSQQLVFAGLSGPSTSRVAVALCADRSWMRRTLEVRDIPVPPTVKLPKRAANAARSYVDDLGEPALAYWQGNPEANHVLTPDSFDREWKAVVEDEPEEEPGQIILEPAHIGELSRVTVAFGSIIDAPSELPEHLHSTAVEAIAAIPGTSCADVFIAHRPDDSYVVSVADVLFTDWNIEPFPARADELARHVIDGELSLIHTP